MSISANDISAQNLLMQKSGQGGWKVAERHADAWIKHHQAEFDGWIAAAKAAANQ
jgi:glycine betaine/proline transport system substrate-binding protein